MKNNRYSYRISNVHIQIIKKKNNIKSTLNFCFNYLVIVYWKLKPVVDYTLMYYKYNTPGNAFLMFFKNL